MNKYNVGKYQELNFGSKAHLLKYYLLWAYYLNLLHNHVIFQHFN